MLLGLPIPGLTPVSTGPFLLTSPCSLPAVMGLVPNCPIAPAPTGNESEDTNPIGAWLMMLELDAAIRVLDTFAATAPEFGRGLKFVVPNVAV